MLKTKTVKSHILKALPVRALPDFSGIKYRGMPQLIESLVFFAFKIHAIVRKFLRFAFKEMPL
jgi:hypothetical protein